MDMIKVNCPYCGGSKAQKWGEEIGHFVDRCEECGFLFLNPRPKQDLIDKAVRSGIHEEAGDLDVTSRRVAKRVGIYKRHIARLFADIFAKGQPISWLDVGSGYGELIEAVTNVAPKDSTVFGVEPMHVKAQAARALGLNVTEGYLQQDHPKVQIVSAIDVFSHVPDFNAFLADVAAVLVDGGEVLIETGNLADIPSRSEFFGELGLPDHVAFAGEKHLVGYLDRAGFDVVKIERHIIDGPVYVLKNFVKKMMGRNVLLTLPFTSKYRTLFIRARKRA